MTIVLLTFHQHVDTVIYASIEKIRSRGSPTVRCRFGDPPRWRERLAGTQWVHLKGHFCPTRHAAAYWREQSKAGKDVGAALIHTSSASGVLANVGQTNYGTAKAGIAAFSSICARELGRYGVRSNAITPNARTRLTAGLRDRYDEPDADDVTWDPQHPGNVSPMVAYLATAGCPITNELFHVSDELVLR